MLQPSTGARAIILVPILTLAVLLLLLVKFGRRKPKPMVAPPSPPVDGGLFGIDTDNPELKPGGGDFGGGGASGDWSDGGDEFRRG